MKGIYKLCVFVYTYSVQGFILAHSLMYVLVISVELKIRLIEAKVVVQVCQANQHV